MKFRRMLKRKFYPTWVSTTKLKGCKAQVFYMPSKNYYHFQIEDGDIYYMSITEGVIFDSFEECCMAAEQWIKDKI